MKAVVMNPLMTPSLMIIPNLWFIQATLVKLGGSQNKKDLNVGKGFVGKRGIDRREGKYLECVLYK